MTTKDGPRAKVAALVGRFEALTPAQVRDTYQEANTRKDFVLGLFRALGWDTDQAEEVFEERKAGRGEVDYAFRIRGVSRFYLEAKPLRDELASHPEWVNQAVSYAYNKSIPYVVLTNFKDLWVFNGDIQPRRFLTLRVDQYLDDFDLLWLLSKEATEQGLLEQEAEKHGALPPRVSVERRLYQDLAEWRGALSRELHLYQPGLSLALVDETVQRLFNRLIFIRSCEDRRIEEPVLQPLARQLRSRTLRGSLWDALKRVFADFDRGYDSELFMPHVLDMQAHFQDDTLAHVMDGLYGTPGGLVAYDFSVIDADVLGRVYEQYLGHVSQMVRQRHQELQARLDLGMPQDQALAETLEVIQRPQRRKAQGIYYTPQWVVDYIVRQTVGRFIQEHRNRPDAIHEMKVLDMACGSGSFLIRAYDELLGFHGQGRLPEWIFSDERLQILRNSIYGVDLDPQAVEIARLNLLLRALRERQRLPELRENIKRGNSLIAEGEPEKHPFDWEREFPEIMRAGGFYIILGNPPYLKEYIDHQPFHAMRNARLARYYQGKMDIWYAFTCLAIDLLKPGGLHSFIATNNWPTSSGASLMRQKILSETQIIEFVDFGDFRVFDTAGIQTMIYILKKTGKPHEGRVRYRRLTRQDLSLPDMNDFLLDSGRGDFANSFDATIESDKKGRPFTFVPDSEGKILEKIAKHGDYRLQPKNITQGIICPQEFVVSNHLSQLSDGNISVGDGIFVLSEEEGRSLELEGRERALLKPYYTTEELGRYYGNPKNKLWVIYTTSKIAKRIDEFPRVKAHLDTFEPIVTSDNRPYGLHRARDENFFVGEKIISLRKTPRPYFTYTNFPCYVSQTFFVLKLKDIDLKYLVAILNSRVTHFWLDKKGKKQGDALQVDKAPLLELPIRVLDLGKPEEKRRHDGIVGLVEEMLALQSRLGPLRGVPSEERAELERHIAQVDRGIDEAVYALYGLTDAERRLVEGEI